MDFFKHSPPFQRPRLFQAAILLLTLLLPTALLATETLDLHQAESLAVARDLSGQVNEKRALSLQEESRSAAQFADPAFSLGYENDFNMNQLMIGLRQEIPRLKNLDLKEAKLQQLAQVERHRGEVAQRSVLRDVRLAWVELWLQLRTAAIIRHHVALLGQLTVTAEERYAAGGLSQQQVVMLQLEKQMQSDRLLVALENEETGRAELARLIGVEPAALALPEELPQLADIAPLAELKLFLPTHPAVLAISAGIKAGDIDTELTDQYYSGTTVDLQYGRNDSEEERFQVMFSVPIPINPQSRQNRLTSARQHQTEATRLQRDDLLRSLESEVESTYRRLVRQEERLDFYRQQILPQSRLISEATLSGYQQGTDDFFNLMRAAVYEQENELKRVRLEADHAKSQARLLFYQGDR
jgi:outer membrane protein, heavy metal efflux system